MNAPAPTITPPHSERAEEAVIGAMLADPNVATDVIGTALRPEHFYRDRNRIIYERIVEAHYADEPIDPITIGEQLAKRLSPDGSAGDDSGVVDQFTALAQAATSSPGDPVDHAKVVKHHADLRRLANISYETLANVYGEEARPEIIAGQMSQKAMMVATDTLLTSEIISLGDLGRRWVQRQKVNIAAREAGIEVGYKFGYRWVDDFYKGLKPSELVIGAGEPGVGKSGVWFALMMSGAERQQRLHEERMRKGETEDRRLKGLILSLEMGEDPSSDRMGQHIGSIDGGKIRDGTISRQDLMRTAQSWAARKDWPLYFNHSSAMRASAMKSLIVEAIMRYRINVVLIDHFRYFDLDRRLDNPNQEDEEKAKFLKQEIAKELNVAVICLAHTTKAIERADKRPRRSDLRGSGQIAAEADFVSFIYRPWRYASDRDKERGVVHRTDAEMIHDKNRHGLEDTADFYCNLVTMAVQ